MVRLPENKSTHRMSVRVYFEDTDAGGIVYYANYPNYAERARTEMFRIFGINSSDSIGKFGVVVVVRKYIIDYFAPAKLDDSLIIANKVKKIGSASIEAMQSIIKTEFELVRILVRLGCLNLSTGKSECLPSSTHEKLLGIFNEPKTI